MREVKFRAWDKTLEKWADGSWLDVDKHGNLYVPAGTGVIEVTQFTGLKDKNGKEIYEGDIIEARNHELYYIKWNDLEASFAWAWYALDSDGKLYESAGSDGTNWALQVSSWEVIGNIYENSELLEKN